MATQIGSLYASMSLESANFVSGINRAARASERGANAIQSGLDRAARAARGFAAVYIADKGREAVSKYLAEADAVKKMEGQLRLATATFGTYGQARRDANAIAEETRSDLAATTGLLGKMTTATKALGGQQSDAARATETFTKALKIGNADKNASTSATYQFGQALSMGVLRGEEFNSVYEASPRIIQLLADSMNTPIGTMRKMAEEGKLTADKLMKALTDPEFTKKIDDEFKALPKTFEDAVQLAENALTRLIGEFDAGSGLSQALADFVTNGSEGMGSLSEAGWQMGTELRAVVEGLPDAFEPFTQAGDSAMEAMGGKILDLRNDIASVLALFDQAINLKVDFQNFERRTENWVTSWWGGEQQAMAPRSDMAGDYLRRYDNSRTTRNRDRTHRYLRDNGLSVTANGELVRPDPSGTPSTFRPPAGAGGSGGRGAGRSAEARRKREERERERAEAEALRNLQAFEDDIERGRVAELQSRQQLTRSAGERAQLERQILDAETARNIRDIDRDGPQGSKRFTEAQATELKALTNRIASQRRQLIDLEEGERVQRETLSMRQAELANTIELAGFDADMARTAADRRAAEYRLLDLQEQQERLALDAIIASRDATDAEKAIAQARRDLLPQLKAQGRRRIEDRVRGPGDAYMNSLPRTAAEINEELERVQIEGLEGLKNGIKDVITGAGSIADAFENMADRVIDGLLEIGLQQMLIKPLGNLLFGGEGEGGGGWLGSLLGSFGRSFNPGIKGGKANGGLANSGRWLVGERGPEVIDVGGPFNVHSNSALSGLKNGGKRNITINVDARGATDPAAIEAAAYRAVANSAPMLREAASQHTMSKANRRKMG